MSDIARQPGEASQAEISRLHTASQAVIGFCVQPFTDNEGSLPEGIGISSCEIEGGTYLSPFKITVEPVAFSVYNTSYNAKLEGEGIPEPVDVLLSETAEDPSQGTTFNATSISPADGLYEAVPTSSAEANLLEYALAAAIDPLSVPKKVRVTFESITHARPEVPETLPLHRQLASE